MSPCLFLIVQGLVRRLKLATAKTLLELLSVAAQDLATNNVENPLFVLFESSVQPAPIDLRVVSVLPYSPCRALLVRLAKELLQSEVHTLSSTPLFLELASEICLYFLTAYRTWFSLHIDAGSL